MTAAEQGPDGRAPRSRRKILFVSEAITLAQVVRLAALARTLDPREYELHFAAGAFSPRVFRAGEFHRWDLFTVPGPRALRRLERGGRLYERRTLERYVAADRDVIGRVKPDLVIGDLRWSLTVSAALENVPLAVLANAYMSPYARRDGGFPLPDHPVVRLLGERLAARYFPRALPRVFDWFARPVNDLRKSHGLPPVGSLMEVLTAGDLTLYADPPELIPMRELPVHHLFLGHVEWSPDDPLPEDWARDPGRFPIYVTVGSSGDIRLLPRILEALSELAVDVLVATADRATELGLPRDPSGKGAARIHVRSFVAGARAAKRARLVISNGGSTTGYQALAAACPVLGLPHNLEQHLAMTAIVAAGAGRSISARNASVPVLRQAVKEMLASRDFGVAAGVLAQQFDAQAPGVVFPAIVARFLAERAGSRPLDAVREAE